MPSKHKIRQVADKYGFKSKADDPADFQVAWYAWTDWPYRKRNSIAGKDKDKIVHGVGKNPPGYDVGDCAASPSSLARDSLFRSGRTSAEGFFLSAHWKTPSILEPLLRQGRKIVCCGVEYSVRGLHHASALQLREGVLEETRGYAAELDANQPRPQAQTRRISGKPSHGSTLQPTREEYGGSWRLALLCLPSARLRLNERHSRRIRACRRREETTAPAYEHTRRRFHSVDGCGAGCGGSSCPGVC